MDRYSRRHYVCLLVASTLVLLFWMVSTAEPCLPALLSGGNSPDDNPIAITECRVSDANSIVISNGDVIVRLGALVLLMGLFGMIAALIQPQRRKRSFAGIAATGATIAFLVYLMVLFFATGVIELTPFGTRMWLSAVVIASFAVALGAAIAASTRYE